LQTVSGQEVTSGLLTGTTADGGSLRVRIVGFSQGNYGSVTGNGDGTLTYTSSSTFAGTDQFSYTLENADGETATGTVTVVVGRSIQAPAPFGSPPEPVDVIQPSKESSGTPPAAGGDAGGGSTEAARDESLLRDLSEADLALLQEELGEQEAYSDMEGLEILEPGRDLKEFAVESFVLGEQHGMPLVDAILSDNESGERPEVRAESRAWSAAARANEVVPPEFRGGVREVVLPPDAGGKNFFELFMLEAEGGEEDSGASNEDQQDATARGFLPRLWALVRGGLGASRHAEEAGPREDTRNRKKS
jgi:hypothetical protein